MRVRLTMDTDGGGRTLWMLAELEEPPAVGSILKEEGEEREWRVLSLDYVDPEADANEALAERRARADAEEKLAEREAEVELSVASKFEGARSTNFEGCTASHITSGCSDFAPEVRRVAPNPARPARCSTSAPPRSAAGPPSEPSKNKLLDIHVPANS
ncbi:hypothetical protein WMF39_17180 [Sorangium sp. So ce1504]|uniref:hypothetical protein n=1 Tax=Sorangium sp. So ce1504 TaxID=3133337 RepID=UPI003F5F51C3